MNASSRILMIAAGGLGDAVLLAAVFPLFQRLAAPGEAIDLVLRSDAAKMGFLFDGKANVRPVDMDRFAKSLLYRRRTLKELRAAGYRLAVSLDHLRHPRRDERLLLEAGAGETAAMTARPWAKYDAELAKNAARLDRTFDSGPVHLDKVLRWTAFANWLAGEDAPPPKVSLGRPAERGEEVILIPFSAVKEKQATPETFAAVIEAAGEAPVVIAGAPDDPARNPDYAALLARPGVAYDAATFEALAPRLARARLVVSVDTAAMHLAVALGAPTLCLASAAYVGEIVPYAPEVAPGNAHFMYTPMDCQGCLGDCILPAENGRFPCVARIVPAEAAARVGELLAR